MSSREKSGTRWSQLSCHARRMGAAACVFAGAFGGSVASADEAGDRDGGAYLLLALAEPGPTAAHGHEHKPPGMSPEAMPVPYSTEFFRPDPDYGNMPYDAAAQRDIYGAKRALITQRPWLELGRDLYNYGPFQPTPNFFGEKNPTKPHLYVYGDWRTAVAYNDNGAVEKALVATRLNLEVDVQLTSTERIHAFFRPLDKNGVFTRAEFGGDDPEESKFSIDGNVDALFFEGDLGAILNGITGEYSTFDLPFAVGILPMLFQNGIWVEDAFTGLAVTIAAKNSAMFDISNYDITFFFGFDKVSTAAVPGTNSKVYLFGVTGFFEMWEGYLEVGYGFTLDDTGFGGSYHNIAAAFTKRYFGWLNNSVRVIANVGQSPNGGAAQTATGVMFLIENSIIVNEPATIVPYFNFFLGVDKPQSLARDAGAGGILKNTGILFETDGLTGFPTMDATGNDAFGVAVGIEFLFDLNMQLVFEIAAQHIYDDNATAPGDQIGVGMRFQIPINNALIIRVDAMYALNEGGNNLSGIRTELRWKF
ncbi:MAG: hypothetical protein WD768_11235 [Phycisphaeraceae bacterium]